MRDNAPIILALAGIALSIGLPIAYVQGVMRTPHVTETCTVAEKYVAREGDGNTYRFVTDECGTLQAGGFFTAGRFDTASVYEDINEGQTYEMEIRGKRIGFFSAFPSIVSYKAV